MTNRQLRKDLLDTLERTPQALSQRVQKLKKTHSITTEDATYVIAQQEGMILDKYLDKQTVDRIRGIIQQISSATSLSQPGFAAGRARAKKITPTERIIIIGKEFKGNDPILPSKILNEAKQMGGVYPLMYVLENSIREFIDRIMSAKHGSDWWDIQAPPGLRDRVNNRMADDERNAWHQRRGAHQICYLDLKQLPALVRKIHKDVVPEFIPSTEWFTQFIEEVYESRCVLCHMNPLDDNNVQAVKVRFNQWQKLIEAKKDLIP